MTTYNKPLPAVEYQEHAPFWEGTRQGELRVQRCADCGRLRWPPHPACPECLSFATEWVAVTPRGRLYTWNICNQAMHPAFRDEVPFAIVIVELADHPAIRFLGRYTGSDFTGLQAGLELEAVFEPVTEEVTLVNWQRAES